MLFISALHLFEPYLQFGTREYKSVDSVSSSTSHSGGIWPLDPVPGRVSFPSA